MKNRLKLLFFEGVSPVRLDSYRRCLAASFGFYMLYLFGNAGEWLTDAGFHVRADTQLMHATHPWPTMAPWMVPVFAFFLFGSVICLITGKFVRPATWVALACAIYVHRVDSLTAFALNKLFIVGFTVLALAPPPREVVREDGSREILQSVWPIRVLQATLLIIYCTSGVAKGIHGDWLTDKDVVWTIVQGVFKTDFSSLLLRTMPRSFFTLGMYLVLGFELFAPVLFIVPKLRPYAVIGGIAFHLTLAAMMSTVIFFSMQMITYYVLFIPEETLISIREWLTPARFKTLPRPEVQTIVEAPDTTDSEKLTKLKKLLNKGKLQSEA